MSARRLLVWVALFVSAGLAVLGFTIFVIGLLVEFLNTRTEPLSADLSPTMQLSLAGLFLTGVMVIFGFVMVMLLLAVQTRRQAPGYGDAYRFMEQLQFNRAIPVLERAVEAGRETSDVLALLTSAYAYTGQYAKAQNTADRAVQLFPEEAGAYVTLATGYRLQASYDEAARALLKAIELAPDQPVIWAELGFVQLRAGNDDQAIDSFKRAAKSPLPPMYSVRVYYHLAQSYKSAGDAEQASSAMARMMSARQGIDAWRPIENAMTGTTYGQSLHYEIAQIEESIAHADAASLR